ncbi:MAG TPA: hypothetical protein VIH58_12045, partial [Chthoniobacterales bacterium]
TFSAVLSMLLDVFVEMFGWNLRFFHVVMRFAVSSSVICPGRIGRTANRQLLTATRCKVDHKCEED